VWLDDRNAKPAVKTAHNRIGLQENRGKNPQNRCKFVRKFEKYDKIMPFNAQTCAFCVTIWMHHRVKQFVCMPVPLFIVFWN